MDPRLEFLLKRHNVRLKLNQNIQRPAYMTRLPTHTELAVQFGVHGAELNEVVAIQLARLTLGQLDVLCKDGQTKLAEWRRAVLEAARMLIADEVVAQAGREGWEPERLAAHCQVTELLAHARLEDWLIQRDVAPYMGQPVSWDDIAERLEGRLG